MGIHDARRHADGNQLLRSCSRTSHCGLGCRKNPDIRKFVEECKRGHGGRGGTRADREKRHADRRVLHASDFRRENSVWVGNYVLISYGEGAVMGVPAHDERIWRSR